MNYNSLRDFIKLLEEKQLLKTISEDVNSNLEITEIHKRILHKRGPALLFDNIIHQGKKSTIPVLANLFGTKELTHS